jgi:hypothetical protein
MCCHDWSHCSSLVCAVRVAVDVKAASDELTVAVLSQVVFGTEPIAALTGESCVKCDPGYVTCSAVTDSLDKLMAAAALRIDYPKFLWRFMLSDHAQVHEARAQLVYVCLNIRDVLGSVLMIDWLAIDRKLVGALVEKHETRVRGTVV